MCFILVTARLAKYLLIFIVHKKAIAANLTLLLRNADKFFFYFIQQVHVLLHYKINFINYLWREPKFKRISRTPISSGKSKNYLLRQSLDSSTFIRQKKEWLILLLTKFSIGGSNKLAFFSQS